MAILWEVTFSGKIVKMALHRLRDPVSFLVELSKYYCQILEVFTVCWCFVARHSCNEKSVALDQSVKLNMSRKVHQYSNVEYTDFLYIFLLFCIPHWPFCLLQNISHCRYHSV
jgi:exoribonuclease II